MQIYTLIPLQPKLIKHYKKYPKASISAQFRLITENPSYAIFSDYVVLAFVVSCARAAGIKVSKSQIQRTLRMSVELKGNRQVLACLLEVK